MGGWVAGNGTRLPFLFLGGTVEHSDPSCLVEERGRAWFVGHASDAML